MRWNIPYCQYCILFSQNGQLFATVLLFLYRNQLTLFGEDVTSVPLYSGEHCFAHSIQDVAVQEVVAVRPYMPTRIFVKENNEWRVASQVLIFILQSDTESYCMCKCIIVNSNYICVYTMQAVSIKQTSR